MTNREKRNQQQKAYEQRKRRNKAKQTATKSRPDIPEIGKENEFREKRGLKNCWNCGREVQLPKALKALGEGSSSGTNTYSAKCSCGETVELKF